MAMPVYAMQMFKLPKSICKEIEKVMARFWWGTNEGQRGRHWFAWKKLSTAKIKGGLGFRDIEKFNDALLGKQVWRFFQNLDSLVARTLRGRYFRENNLLNSTQPTNCSYVWRSLLHGRQLMLKGLRFIIGSGTSIQTWEDPWLPTNPPRPPLPKNTRNRTYTVADLIDTNRTWNERKLEEFIHADDIPLIHSLKLSQVATIDYLGWHYTTSGLYTVKSAYKLASQENSTYTLPVPGDPSLKQAFWKLKIAPKLQHFLWKLLSQSLPTGENLRHRHIVERLNCPRCCTVEDSSIHIFFECPYAIAVWRTTGIGLPALFDGNQNLEAKLLAILNLYKEPLMEDKHKQVLLWTLWRLWKSRNYLLYQNTDYTWLQSASMAQSDALEWISANATIHQDDNQNRVPQQNTQSPPTWQKPPDQWVKCNYDCSFLAHLQSTVGIIIRDFEGLFKGACQIRGNMVSTPLEGELQALLLSLQFCWSRGLSKVIFEGDCAQINEIMT